MTQKQTTVKSYHKLLKKFIIAGVLLITILTAGIVFFFLYHSKTDYEEQAAVTTRNITIVLDENLSGIIKKIDITLLAVRDEAEQQLASGGIQPDVLDRYIIRQQSRLPELATLRATNAAGDAVYGPKATVTTTTNLAHRDYFQLIRDNPQVGLVISKPLVGGISGKWMIILARRLNGPDGAFAGLIYAGLGIDYLTEKFRQLNVGNHGSITLLDRDLSLIAHYPSPISLESEIGKRVGSRELSDLIESGEVSGTYSAISHIDGVNRLFSYSRISLQPPYYIVTGLSITDYMSKWRLEAAKMLLLWILFSGTIIVATCFFWRGWQKITQLEEKVTERNKLKSILDTIPDCVYIANQSFELEYINPPIEKDFGQIDGRKCYQYFHDRRKVCPWCRNDDVFAGRKIKDESIFVKTGKTCDVFGALIINADDTLSRLTIFRDITERKQAEELLRQSEERYRLIFENAPLGIVHFDDTSTITACNNYLFEIIGAPKDKIIGFNLLQNLVDQKMVGAVKTAFTGEVGYYEDDYLTIYGGKLRSIRGFFQRILSSEGNFIGGLGILEDITARRLAEKESQQRQHDLETILDNLPGYAFFKDCNHVYMMANKMFCEAVGVTNEHLRGKTDYDLFPPAIAEKYRQDDEIVMRQQQPYLVEEETMLSDGKTLAVSTRKVPLIDLEGKVTGLIGLGFDLTERKHAEELIKESEERLQLALLGADLGMWDWNIKTGKVIVDSRWTTMLGYSPEDIQPHIGFWEKLLHPDDKPQVQELLNAHLDGKISYYETEHRLLHKSGEWVWVLDKGKVTHRDKEGVPLRAVGTHLDITARKQAEEQIRLSLREKEVLLREIHHRVKNNLQIVAGIINMQSRMIKEPTVKEMLQDCQTRIRSMALVHESLYRSTSLAQINLHEYLRSLGNTIFRSYCAGRKIKFTAELAATIQTNIETAIPCGLILAELLSNALKYAFPDNRPGEILLSLQQNAEDKIVLTIKDNGIGIPADLDLAATNSLGMSLVNDFVQFQLKGQMVITRDRGTEFQITFEHRPYPSRI